jgi:hypothetical protein
VSLRNTERQQILSMLEQEAAYVQNEGERKQSQATRLVEFLDGADLFHSPDGIPYVSGQIDNHSETWPVKSAGFRRWIACGYYRKHCAVPSSQALQDAINVISGKCRFDGPQREVFVRVAEYHDAVYLDLGDEHWRAIEVTQSGWRIVDDPTVRFRRARGMLMLPTPVHGGRIDELDRFINIRGEDLALVRAWLISAARAQGPYPILCLHGEQGTAKSTTAKALRSLIDPNESPLRTVPRDERDFYISASINPERSSLRGLFR